MERPGAQHIPPRASGERHRRDLRRHIKGYRDFHISKRHADTFHESRLGFLPGAEHGEPGVAGQYARTVGESNPEWEHRRSLQQCPEFRESPDGYRHARQLKHLGQHAVAPEVRPRDDADSSPETLGKRLVQQQHEYQFFEQYHAGDRGSCHSRWHSTIRRFPDSDVDGLPGQFVYPARSNAERRG